jgi:hypothetical protein
MEDYVGKPGDGRRDYVLDEARNGWVTLERSFVCNYTDTIGTNLEYSHLADGLLATPYSISCEQLAWQQYRERKSSEYEAMRLESIGL